MKTALACAATTTLLAAGIGTAHAQAQPAPASAAPAPASQPPPPGSDGTDVSHIRGQLVPVGEHNEYYYSFRRTNVSTNPLGYIFGIYGVSVSHAVGDHLVIRGDANLFRTEDASGTEFGVGLPLYLRRAYQGPFLEPGFIVRTMEDDDSGASRETDSGIVMMVGWHASWDSGFNLAAALGAGRDLSDDDELFPAGYLRFGYAF